MAAFIWAAGAFAGTATHHPEWGTVLDRFVDDAGRVDFAAIRSSSGALRAQVEFVGRTAPESLESPDAAMAFLLNSYNCLAMSHAALSGLEPASKVRFFFLSRHTVGGRRLSLRALENDLIRTRGDPRVHFALNCMVRGCPRLPRQPFRAEDLQARLNRAAVEFFAAERHVRVDDREKTVHFSSILKWYREDFLERAPSLIEYANRYREDKIPAGYRVEFLPYDWTLNQR